MPTFIDESGDTGGQPDSASYFRLAAVWVPTLESAEAIRQTVQQLRGRLGLSAAFEFKFAKTGSHVERREAFFKTVMPHEFRFAAACVDKRQEDWLTAGRGIIHWACAVSLASALRPTYCAAEQARLAVGNNRPLAELVVVDDNQDQRFLAVIKRKFRELRSPLRPGTPLVGKVKFRGSGPDELIQLADMVCGAVGAYLDGDSTWYDVIASRDLGIIRVP